MRLRSFTLLGSELQSILRACSQPLQSQNSAPSCRGDEDLSLSHSLICAAPPSAPGAVVVERREPEQVLKALASTIARCRWPQHGEETGTRNLVQTALPPPVSTQNNRSKSPPPSPPTCSPCRPGVHLRHGSAVRKQSSTREHGRRQRRPDQGAGASPAMRRSTAPKP